MKTTTKHQRYIPDHIRAMRTDRLVHYRESLLLMAARALPRMWVDQVALDRVNACHRELIDVNEMLHRREMKHDKAHRATRKAAYQEDWN